MLKKILMIGLFAMVMVSSVYGACVTPVENVTINTNSVLCGDSSTIYNLNDSDGGGVIRIGASNIVLDCNGTTLLGNRTTGSSGINRAGEYTNVTIKNCNLSNYYQGIFLYSGNEYNVTGCHFHNNSESQIKMRNPKRHNINNNTFYLQNYTASVSTGFGIYLYNDGGNNTIEDNTFTGTSYAIRINDNVINSTIQGNTITNPFYNGIMARDEAVNTYIYSNTISGAPHNSIAINVNDSIVSHNTLSNDQHHCIDMNAETSTGTALSNITVYNNSCTYTTSFLNANAFYLFNASDINIQFNRVVDAPANGIFIDNYKNSTGNTFQDNTIGLSSSSSGYCVFHDGDSNTFQNNTFSNCNSRSIRDTGGDSIYTDNSYTEGYCGIWADTNPNRVNITVNETSTQYHRITTANSGQTRLYYNGRKAFNIDGNTIEVYDLTAPNNDIVNFISGALINRDVTDVSMSLSSGDHFWIIDFDSYVSLQTMDFSVILVFMVLGIILFGLGLGFKFMDHEYFGYVLMLIGIIWMLGIVSFYLI